MSAERSASAATPNASRAAELCRPEAIEMFARDTFFSRIGERVRAHHARRPLSDVTSNRCDVLDAVFEAVQKFVPQQRPRHGGIVSP